MKELKSITSPSLCPCISILVFLLTIIIYTNRVVSDDENEYNKIIQDLPTATDFDYYLSALEKAVDFCFTNKHYIDLNLQVGLFLIDVNLREVVQQEGMSIPAEILSRLETIFEKNDVLAEYYQSMVQTNRNVTNYKQNIKLALLFYNETTWLKPNKFNTELLNETTFYGPEEVEEIFGEWENYYDNLHDLEKNIPLPGESDSCIAVLALTNPVYKAGGLQPVQPNCLLPYRCKLVMQGGNKFGYGLTHRILFMAVARFSRRCNVFSEIQDRYMTEDFCKRCFNEAQFIASNNFLLPDLMYEQITFCGFFGHAQFLRNGFLKVPLKYQTSDGCFSEMGASTIFDENQTREDENDEWKIERGFDIMNGHCNGHFTAVAVGALSNALRYIIQTYYS